MINNERISMALKFLTESDEPCANWKVEVARKEYLCKVARAKIFHNIEGSVESRKARAEIDQDVTEAEEARFMAMAEYEKMKAKRETEALVIEVWRTFSANLRQGNL